MVTGKDIVIFVTPEEHKKPSTVTLADAESEPGISSELCVVCVR